MRFSVLGSNILERNVLGLDKQEVAMLRSLIFALKCHARRVWSRRPLDYRPEPMPRLQWYR